MHSAKLLQTGPDETWWADPLECHCFLRNRSSSHRCIVALVGKMEKTRAVTDHLRAWLPLVFRPNNCEKGSVRIRRKAANREMLGRDGCEALGLGTPWVSENEAGRVRLIGAADKRHLTIPTVVSQLIVECATERVVQGMPELEKDFVQLQREPLVHPEHMPGADRVVNALGC